VEHVLATQTLVQAKAKSMRVNIDKPLAFGLSAKDLALAIIAELGTAGGTGYVIEYAGQAVRDLSIEARMTLCNMTIEAGARAGLIAPDDKCAEYFAGRPMSPSGADWDKATAYWATLYSDDDAVFDKEITIDLSDSVPLVTWGTSPEDVAPANGLVPADGNPRALEYMGLEAGQPIRDIAIDKVFIGSCTNGRIEDLRIVAEVLKGWEISETIKLAMIVPGSGLVKKQAEDEGLDKIFIAAGFDWREAGCSMCLAMNDDKLESGERCASTSNRNFEGRQGRGGRTHLMSPAMAAAAAIAGRITDARCYLHYKEGA